ncbi:HK97-gp10 family putative phage morphogenesis protein [Kumtagia ephedrae]|nr:HK97-gp10 family putative phage morphogenesis protein [Mesorhizobium ephedrae]
MKIAGKQKFLAQIDALPQALRTEIRKALEQSAEETTDLMRRFAPVESGALRASIGYSFGEAPKGALSSAARTVKAEAGLAVTLFAGGGKAFYARFQEFGTQEMSANPYFFPAYRLARKRVRARMARAMRNGAKKALGK